MLPPSVAFTERLTDPVGQWHGRWVGGTFSDTGGNDLQRSQVLSSE